MIPGPTIVLECSNCKGHIIKDTIASGNTFGALFWTDGKIDAPMLPNQLRLVKCRHCGALVWIDEQRKIDEFYRFALVEFMFDDDNERVSRLQQSKKFKDTRPGLPPMMQDYLDVLARGESNREKEYYLRLRTWWIGNDVRRDSMLDTPMSKSEIDNLRSFISLLDEADQQDRILKAEAMRELSMFEEAEMLLAASFDEQLMETVRMIRNLTRKQISVVKRIDSEYEL